MKQYETELKEFLEYLYQIGSESTTEEELQDLYNEHICIEFNHHQVAIPFDAESYCLILSLIEHLNKNL